MSPNKLTNIETLSMNKDRHIISEIRGFFAESDNTKAIQGVMNVMDHIQITQRQMGFAKAENCKLILFTVKNRHLVDFVNYLLPKPLRRKHFQR